MHAPCAFVQTLIAYCRLEVAPALTMCKRRAQCGHIQTNRDGRCRVKLPMTDKALQPQGTDTAAAA